jgi:ankyrin repeat protein
VSKIKMDLHENSILKKFKEETGLKSIEDIYRSACREGRVDIVKELLNEGMDSDLSCKEDEKPIHIAVKKNNIEIIKLMLEKGADVNYLINGTTSPLWIACLGGMKFEIVKLLLENGADPNLEWKLKKQGIRLSTPIYEACFAGELKIIEILLDYGAEDTFLYEDNFDFVPSGERENMKNFVKEYKLNSRGLKPAKR